jgi:hypothetical protein
VSQPTAIEGPPRLKEAVLIGVGVIRTIDQTSVACLDIDEEERLAMA